MRVSVRKPVDAARDLYYNGAEQYAGGIIMEVRDENGLTERAFLAAYKDKHYPAPYLTADVVLLSEGRDVLLIRRKGHPYLGCWALPGGFVNPDESAAEGALRELMEETNVTGFTEDDIYEIGLFSKPGRDPRGWIVSDAFLVPVDRRKIAFRSGDDAADAAWITVTREGGSLRFPEGVALAFDHADVLKKAFALYDRIRG